MIQADILKKVNENGLDWISPAKFVAKADTEEGEIKMRFVTDFSALNKAILRTL